MHDEYSLLHREHEEILDSSGNHDSIELFIELSAVNLTIRYHKGFEDLRPISSSEEEFSDSSDEEIQQSRLLKKIAPDGNCLFVAIVTGLQAQRKIDQRINAVNLRKVVVNAMISKKNFLEPLIISKIKDIISRAINAITKLSAQKKLEANTVLEDSFLKNMAISGYSGEFFIALKSILASYYDTHSDTSKKIQEEALKNIIDTQDSESLFTKYCKSMEQQNTWGDAIVVQMISAILKINIKIHQTAQDEGYYIRNAIQGANEIHLLNANNRHFDLLIPSPIANAEIEEKLQSENENSEEEDIKREQLETLTNTEQLTITNTDNQSQTGSPPRKKFKPR